jgi:hypothetical protein
MHNHQHACITPIETPAGQKNMSPNSKPFRLHTKSLPTRSCATNTTRIAESMDMLQGSHERLPRGVCIQCTRQALLSQRLHVEAQARTSGLTYTRAIQQALNGGLTLHDHRQLQGSSQREINQTI